MRYAPFLMCGLVCMLAGCSTLPKQPEIVSAGINPPQLQPGDAAIIAVEIQDRFNIVHKVEGVVKEDTAIIFRLKDDGVAPDAKADDNIWTLQVDVPFNAPAGDFGLTLTAYDDKGEPILIHDANGDAVPLSAAFGIAIQWPKPAAPEPAAQP